MEEVGDEFYTLSRAQVEVVGEKGVYWTPPPPSSAFFRAFIFLIGGFFFIPTHFSSIQQNFRWSVN